MSAALSYAEMLLAYSNKIAFWVRLFSTKFLVKSSDASFMLNWESSSSDCKELSLKLFQINFVREVICLKLTFWKALMFQTEKISHTWKRNEFLMNKNEFLIFKYLSDKDQRYAINDFFIKLCVKNDAQRLFC